jgi:acetyl-CoA synthetase
LLAPAANYEDLARNFRWRVPEFYNMGVDVSDQHADGGGRLALIYVDEARRCRRYTFDDIRRLSNRFANVLLEEGLRPGDRVGVLLPQAPETAVAHVAAFKAGLISVPLFTLFGEDALEYRLANSGAKAIVTDEDGLGKIRSIRDRLPALSRTYIVDSVRFRGGMRGDPVSFETAIERASERFTPAKTRADDPALIIYTSGTTGNPKGALHAHRVLLGHLPGVELSHDFFPQQDDLIWTPADWAWIGGLLDVLLPAWHHGIAVLASRARKFDPEAAMELMANYHVRNVFLPPTALRLMRQAKACHPGVRLRTLASGGESLGEDLLGWGKETFGLTINEFYGQTECNMIVSNDSRLFPVRPGSMGRAVPGHDVRVVDDAGKELPRGEIGMIGVRRPDPVMFLGYWKDEAATEKKFAGKFLLTGDLARHDSEGYFTFVGRSDDLITSAGYRIGPGEIEECLARHPAIAAAAVVGVPDSIRTEVVKAWIVLKPGFAPSDNLAREIQDFVRVRLAAHEYPRQIGFLDTLPLTVTGKVLRRELRQRG